MDATERARLTIPEGHEDSGCSRWGMCEPPTPEDDR